MDGQIKKLEYNGAGWLTKVTNNNSAFVTYNYYSNGLEKETKINDAELTKILKSYDAFGKLEMYTDYNKLGSLSYFYNSFGELIKKIDQKSRVTEYLYDKLGRMYSRTSPEGTTQWQYDTQPHGKGKLDYVLTASNTGYVTSVKLEDKYNQYTQLTSQTQTLNDKKLVFNYVHDVHARPKETVYPSGYTVTNYYNGNGYLNEKRDNENHVLWHAEAMDARGNFTGYKLGNNINSVHLYDKLSGLVTDITAGTAGSDDNIQNFNYHWSVEGNLEYRKDLNKNLTETFQYQEGFNRLTDVYLGSNHQLEMHYDPSGLGNITYKSDVGNYTYGINPNMDAGPYAVTGIDNPAGTISTTTQNIAYTSFDKVKQIEEGNNSLSVCYDYDLSKVWQSLVTDNNSVARRYFNNSFEEKTENGNKKQIHYITAPTGLIAIFTVDNNEVKTINYILKDHLGSLTHLLDAQGNLVEEQNFDAWGRLRNPADLTYDNVPQTHLFNRGFTGHEHLAAFKLIDMKGRMYDPAAGRFLSVDPTIQFTDNTQSYNRYSYVLNNPLRYTDPSGFNLDWFTNELTGDVYYNNTYGKNDADKIEGKGWVWFGGEDVFSKGKQYENSFQIIWENKELITDYHQKYETNVAAFNLESTFKGQKALTFMKKMGYEFRPVQQVIYSQHFTIPIQGAPRQPSLELRITERSRYFESDFYETGWSYLSLKDPIINETKTSTEFVGRSIIYYSNNKLLNIYLKLINTIYPVSPPAIWNSWLQYPNNVKLINDYNKKYGKQ